MSNMYSKISMLLVVTCLLSCKASAVTRYVSLDGTNDVAGGYTNWAGAATTIQAAISASAVGDWIWVSNGTYEVGVIPSDRGDNRVAITTAVTIAAWDDDRTATIIKGGQDIRPVFIGNNVTLSGFTITGGNLTDNEGGGIYGNGVNSVVSNCLITGNAASSRGGGGVFSVGHLLNCDVINNTSAGGGGIAANIDWGSLTVRCCNVVYNRSSQYAGGVRASYVFDSQIVSNTADIGGGGGYGALTNFYMSNCVIKFNTAANHGGGVYQYNLFNCDVISNNAATYGGGIHSFNAADCLIVGNTAAARGGGVYCSKLVNCEVRGNYAATNGGGVYLVASYSISNCLVAGNEAGTQAGGVWGNTGARVENCTIVGNAAYSYGGTRYITAYNVIAWSNHSKVGTANQFTADHYSCAPECTNATSITMAPQLVDYGSGYGTNHVAGDYRLQKTSPCINTGTNLPWMIDDVDLDGRQRLDRFTRLVDMGCYEYVWSGTMFSLR